MNALYENIVQHYEKCFDEHGATHKGVDWPNSKDLLTRFEVMLQLCGDFKNAKKPIKLLDLGCGYGALYQHLQECNYLQYFDYTGIDLSEKMITCAQEKFSASHFLVHDVLKNPLASESFDFVLMNGLLTEKVNLSHAEMVDFATQIIRTAFSFCRKGIVFNVMSEHVDWKRDELFYLPFDELALILRKHCSRHFVFRADYGLYEYSAYVYKQPVNWEKP